MVFSSFQKLTVVKALLIHYRNNTLRGLIMAILVFRSETRLRLQAGAMANSASGTLLAKRMTALSTPAADSEAKMPAPDALRRPGMAARWKGQHRLAFAG